MNWNGVIGAVYLALFVLSLIMEWLYILAALVFIGLALGLYGQWRRFHRGELTKQDILKKLGIIFAVICIMGFLWANAAGKLSITDRITFLCFIAFGIGAFIGYMVGEGTAQNQKYEDISYIRVPILNHQDDGSYQYLGDFWFKGSMHEMRCTGKVSLTIDKGIIIPQISNIP